MTEKNPRKFISWNVNGIRAIQKKGFDDFLSKHPFDVLCLQETRASEKEAALAIPGTHVFWNEAQTRKGYAGTAIISRIKPLSVQNGMDSPPYDQEGRVITAEFPDFFLVNVYTPNAGRDLSRLSYREKEWDPLFLSHLKKLEKKKPVIFCGDLNVSHKEIDLANPRTNVRNAGFTEEERRGFSSYVENGFIDTFRNFNSEGGHYTWWSYRFNARARNIGWRIDYFCASAGLSPRLSSAGILSDVGGSDHCPVTLLLKD